MSISLLCPTRGRPGPLKRMIQSVIATATNAVEVVCYLDHDDRELLRYAPVLRSSGAKSIYGPRIMLSDCWNKCFAVATGEILMQCNDDVIFRTPDWDQIVENAFAASRDKILLVHGLDGSGSQGENFGPHPFVHRKWIETLGYFTPPYFCSDFGDTWLNELANKIGRNQRVPILVEHLHPSFGKADYDMTTRERLARADKENPSGTYDKKAPEREEDAKKLEAAKLPEMPYKWSILTLTQPARSRFLKRLLDRLMPQLADYPQVEFKQRMFDSALSLGANRQAMLEQSQGQYVNFVDDDDMVPQNYIKTILPLLDGVDYIGFQLQYYLDGVAQKPTFHSLRYKEWNSDQEGFYRDISHVNPLRRDLALLVPMEGGVGEDQRWAERLRRLAVVKTEHYVDAVMYDYLYRSTKPELAEAQKPVFTDTAPPVGQSAFPPCPACGATCIGSHPNGRRCNQCGHVY